MAADKANVRPDLVAVSVGGAEYHVAKVTLLVGGTKIGINPANLGEVVGYIQGARNFEIEIDWLETAPAVVRALAGFDGSGTDAAAAVGTHCPEVEIRVWDPLDSARLAQLICPACVLMSWEPYSREGRETPAVMRTTYMAVRHSSGVVYQIGSGS